MSSNWLPPATKFFSYQIFGRTYFFEAIHCRGTCKVLCPNRTKMFHVKHFWNNSKLEKTDQLVRFAPAVCSNRGFRDQRDRAAVFVTCGRVTSMPPYLLFHL